MDSNAFRNSLYRSCFCIRTNDWRVGQSVAREKSGDSCADLLYRFFVVGRLTIVGWKRTTIYRRRCFIRTSWRVDSSSREEWDDLGWSLNGSGTKSTVGCMSGRIRVVRVWYYAEQLLVSLSCLVLTETSPRDAMWRTRLHQSESRVPFGVEGVHEVTSHQESKLAQSTRAVRSSIAERGESWRVRVWSECDT